MRSYVKFGAVSLGVALAVAMSMPAPARAAELLSADSIDQLGARQFWRMSAPVQGDDCVVRTVLLDDNLYLLTAKNIAYAIHAKTGVIRWTAQAAEPGQSLRGPTHSAQYVFFTAPAAVKVLDRATGDLASELRAIRGVIIEINHDIATVSIGRANGIQPGDMLKVFRSENEVGDASKTLADFRVTVVNERQSKGEVLKASRTVKVVPGMRIAGEIKVPLREVKLPFAATSPAVADSYNLFVGSANQRLYSLDILGGFRNWETTVKRTLTAKPLLLGDELYVGSEGGRVMACVLGASRRDEARRKWEFETEGPIFYDLAADAQRVFAASNDRILYALDRKSGRREWTRQFDNPPDAAPVVAGGRVFQSITGEGLYCLDAVTGKQIWHLSEPAHYLAQYGETCFVYGGTSNPEIVRLDASTGSIKSRERTAPCVFANASHDDQMILLADGCGEVMCLRPKSAPPLKPAELASVLQNDARARELARMTSEQRARAAAQAAPEEPKRPDIKFIEEDDLLGSRSTAKPAGGRDLVEVDADKEKVEDSTDKEDAKPADEGGEEEDATSDEEESDDSADSDDEDADSADEDEEDGDKDTEGDDEESGDDDEEGDSEEEESGDEDEEGDGEDEDTEEEGGDDESGDDEGGDDEEDTDE